MDNILNIDSEQRQKLQISALIITAVALTIGIAWSNAINSLINQYFPEDQNATNAWYKVYYAAVLTMVVSIFMRFL